MKLYSDEESDYICRDSRAIPLALRDQVFNLIMDDDHVSLFNPLGYQKRTYHTPTNVNLYSEAVSLQMGIEPAGFVNEYNKLYDVWYKAMQDREARAEKDQYSTFFNSVPLFVTGLQRGVRDEQRIRKEQEIMASAAAERGRRAALRAESRAVRRALSPPRTRASASTVPVNTPEGSGRLLASSSVLGSRTATTRNLRFPNYNNESDP